MQDKLVPVLLSMVVSGEERMHSRAVEKRDMAQVKDDGINIGPLQMHDLFD